MKRYVIPATAMVTDRMGSEIDAAAQEEKVSRAEHIRRAISDRLAHRMAPPVSAPHHRGFYCDQ